MINGRYADIIVTISHEKVDRPFQYRIPETLLGKITIGMCVIVPFGAGNKELAGYVIGKACRRAAVRSVWRHGSGNSTAPR